MIRALPSGPAKRMVDCWFFLFNDILLVASESTKSSMSLLDMIGSSKAQYKVREVISVRKIAVDEAPGVPGYPYSFEMQVSNRQPDRFFTKMQADRDAWVVCIRNALKVGRLRCGGGDGAVWFVVCGKGHSGTWA
jgi:PH domain